MSLCECTGWWQQTGLGKQPMDDLWLEITQGKISGAGRDIVAAFEFTGNLLEDGRVKIFKKYLRRHAVLYVGKYDGEGTLYGKWDIAGERGEWLIHLSTSAESKEIQDIEPSSPHLDS